MLRSVPAPPHDVPASLTQAVAAVPLERRRPTRRRFAVAVAFAASSLPRSRSASAAGRADDFTADYAVDFAPTARLQEPPRSSRSGSAIPDSGNVELVLEVSGLPKVADDEFYALWLEKDGEWAATCGYFSVGEGETTVRMTVSYQLPRLRRLGHLDRRARRGAAAARGRDPRGLGGFGGTSLVAGVRWSFRGKDAGSA